MQNISIEMGFWKGGKYVVGHLQWVIDCFGRFHAPGFVKKYMWQF